MATLNLKRFTQTASLRAIEPQLLIRFLQPFESFFSTRGVSLAPSEPPGELDYKGLIDVFMHPDVDTPDMLAEALYLINELATADGMDQLMEEAERNGIEIDYLPDSPPIDIAIQVWLADSDTVRRKHAEQFLFRPKSFEYFQSKAESKSIGKITEKKLRALEHDLDDWFEKKNRGRTSRVFEYPRSVETWFLIRHGDPYKREGGIEQGESTSFFYRPEAFDVVVYNSAIGEIRINAGSIGIKKLYRQMFGRHFFGDENFFPQGGKKYTLDPLKTDGEHALVCSDVQGLEWVKLRELQIYKGGPYGKVEIHKASDLMAAFPSSGGPIKKRFRIGGAKFEVKFENSKSPRMLTVRPPNIANFTRDGDSGILELWLSRRGFVLNAVEEIEQAAQVTVESGHQLHEPAMA